MKSEIASLKLFLIKVMLNYSSTEHLIIILDVTLVSRLVRSPLYLSGSAPPPKKRISNAVPHTTIYEENATSFSDRSSIKKSFNSYNGLRCLSGLGKRKKEHLFRTNPLTRRKNQKTLIPDFSSKLFG